MDYYPKGSRYTALEKNVLKYRAFEMVLILFRVQELRRSVVESIRATDQLGTRSKSHPPRLPDGVRRPDKRAWQILVKDGIITPDERTELEALIDYRNVVAHATELLTVDLNRSTSRFLLAELRRYEPKAFDRLEYLAEKISAGMATKHYMMSLSLQPALFHPAQQIYKEELGRLRAKIHKQARALQAELDDVNTNISSLPVNLLERLEPGHPRNMTAGGTLSRHGIACCYALFRAGAKPLAVAYMMRISLRSVQARFRDWKSNAGKPDLRDA